MADGSTIHSFRSLAEAHEFVKLEEIKSCMKYVLVARTRDATVTAVKFITYPKRKANGMHLLSSEVIKLLGSFGLDYKPISVQQRKTIADGPVLCYIQMRLRMILFELLLLDLPIDNDVQSVDGFLIKFEDTRGEVPVAYDGVPFIQLGTEVRECHQGPDRKKKRTEASLEESGDHEYSGKNRRKRSCIQTSKKLGCTAKVKFRMLIRFPRFKINGPDSRKSRKEIVQRLKDATLTDDDKKYSVLVRFCGQHHDHVIGEDAGYGQPLDASVISKIKSLVVDDGLRNAGEIQKHIELIRKNVPECPKTNRRFNPSLQDIRFHMSAAIHCNRYSGDDQENLIGLINTWKEEHPEDKYFFQPASVDESGHINNLLFVHQSHFQRRLLSKYGQEMVLMDSTYKTMRYNLPLFFLAVLTNVGYCIVATFIVGHETRKDISAALSMLKSWNETWMPNAFMCDLDQREIGAVEHTFEGCLVFTCAFHREQAWDRWLKQTKHKAYPYKETILKDLRRIAGSRSNGELDENIQILKNSEVFQTNNLFRRWIETVWLSCTERWVRGFRNHVMEVRVTSTNGLEALHRSLKVKYLKRHGSTRTLSSLVTTIVDHFAPDNQDRYVRQNVLARANYRKYSTDVPLFLHNRPRLFVEHCMKRWGKVEIDSIKQTKNGFLVDPYNIDTDVPECSCPDFIKTGWPCKHLLAVFQFFPSYGWEFLPQEYTTLPVFNLDDGECQVQQESTVHQHQGSTACSSVRKETIELLSDLKNATYAINSDEVLYKLNSALQDVKKSIEQNIPTIGIIPARTSRTKRKAPDRTSSVPYKYTSDVIMEEDELSKVLCDIWSGPESEDPIVQVGQYTISNRSFHYLLEELPDEVVDASLHILCRNRALDVLHVPTALWNSILLEPSDSLHQHLQTENIYSYHIILGALNEGGNHWTLALIKPKEHSIIYMNPLGENNHTRQRLLSNWNYRPKTSKTLWKTTPAVRENNMADRSRKKVYFQLKKSLPELENASDKRDIYCVEIGEDDSPEFVRRSILQTCKLPNTDTFVLKVRNHRGSLIPISHRLATTPSSKPFILQVVDVHQNVKANPRSVKIKSYNDTMKDKLTEIEKRIEMIEDSAPELDQLRNKRINNEMKSVEQMLEFLTKRLKDAETAHWRGMFKKNPLW